MRPYNITERIVKTVKLAAEFGPLETIKSPARNLNFIQFYNLDILTIFIAFFYSIIFAIKKLSKLIFRPKIKVKFE